MAKLYFLIFLILTGLNSFAQDGNFKFGILDREHIATQNYEKDSTANAYVINEFGYAFISSADNTPLIFEYHVKIKVLNEKGLDQANISIPLRKNSNNSFESIRDIKTVTFNLDGGVPQTTELDPKKIYKENLNSYYDVVKFALPNVKPGSIIEYTYTIESPYIFNFRKWEFQSSIPKIKSEFWAKIPANYNYNLALKGYHKLSIQDAKLEKDCFRIGSSVADCSLMKYGMANVPAFIEEEYMTATDNYLASLNFELIEIKYFNGSVNKITKTWADIYKELKTDTDFGLQIKRHSELFKNQIESVLVKETDKKAVATKVFQLVKDRYQWNNYYGKYAELGLKKAYDSRTGNIGDINLALIGALQFAKIETEPVLVSTRNNGFPTKIFPVLSDFNYVIAKVNIDGESYLLDASDKDLPFGLLPYHCLNSEGRAIGKDSCYWVDLVPKEKFKKTDFINLKIDAEGDLVGSVLKKYTGYEALKMRRTIKKFASESEYVEDLDAKLAKIKIINFKISNLDSLDAPLIEEFNIKVSGFDNISAENLIINPFILNQLRENPFKLSERLYPVNFGAPIEQTTIFVLEIPENFKLKYAPQAVALALPEKGGKYIYQVSETNNNSITITEIIHINKTEFENYQYPYLKELYNKIVQANKSDLIITKRL